MIEVRAKLLPPYYLFQVLEPNQSYHVSHIALAGGEKHIRHGLLYLMRFPFMLVGLSKYLVENTI